MERRRQTSSARWRRNHGADVVLESADALLGTGIQCGQHLGRADRWDDPEPVGTFGGPGDQPWVVLP